MVATTVVAHPVLQVGTQGNCSVTVGVFLGQQTPGQPMVVVFSTMHLGSTQVVAPPTLRQSGKLVKVKVGQGAGALVVMVVTVVMSVGTRGHVFFGAWVITGKGTGSERAGMMLGMRERC